MNTTFWAFPIYISMYSRGQTTQVGGPDLAREPPVENPCSSGSFVNWCASFLVKLIVK